MAIPRSEHPRPQFRRPDWINLNGTWTFTFDPGKSGLEAGLAAADGFDREITVPFCPESELSGVGHTDFIEAMWYHRKIDIPTDWAGRRVLLHLGGVDYESEVFIDGQSLGLHFGGTVGFSHDLTGRVRAGGTHDLVVRVFDDTRADQPRGKQCDSLRSRGCSYTRTTGIWQTVWLEATATCGLKGAQVIPDLDGGRFTVIPSYHQVRRGLTFRAELRDGDAVVAEAEAPAADGAAAILPVADPHPWVPGDPHLYDLTFEVRDEAGAVVDSVASYAGLRKVHIEGNRIYLNNRPIFLRLVLDQGFYPDGIWTAPTDAALKRDIEFSLAAGFNGARLHQKVFEERFHYWADKLGYLTWGESASWGADPNDIPAGRNFITEWAEIVCRDRNHPSIIAWTPFNETGTVSCPAQHHRLHLDAYNLCKALDPTRPVNDTSGYVHVRTDLWTVHNYEQDPAKLAEMLTPTDAGVWRNSPDHDAAYAGQPYLVDEYGGIKWNPANEGKDRSQSWGYGKPPASLEEFYQRLAGLTDVLLGFEHVSGFCYTQLTDIEQEQNGIYYYDRTGKFDMARIAAALGRKPDWAEL